MEAQSLAKSRHSWQRVSLTLALGGVCLLLASGVASAQQIGGTVTDATGAVLPGVTVEARSPVLIEGVRTTVSDGSGKYLIVGLEPGVYRVSYALPGFSTFIREGIQLTTGFTATVDVRLAVGGVDETVTVSGQSPVVDVQNVQQRAIMDRQVIDNIPTGKSFQAYALLVPGMETSAPTGSTLRQDSGGIVVQGYQTLGIHGGGLQDSDQTVNGMSVSSTSSLGIALGFIADGNYDEMSVEYSAHSAETATGGVSVRAIPREGGNTFRGAFFGTFAVPQLLADNVDQDLRNRGARRAFELDETWLVNPSVGGPIVRDRLWFFVGHTTQRANLFPANVYMNQNPAAFTYVADLSRPALEENQQQDTSLHLNWQATAKDKFKVLYSYNSVNKPHALQGQLGANFIAPESALNIRTRLHLSQVAWARPATNRLLLEGGFSAFRPVQPHEATAEAVITLPGILDLPSRVVSRNMQPWIRKTRGRNFHPRHAFRASTAYVTGGHNLKVGFIGNWLKTVDKSDSGSNWVDVITLQGTPLFANFRTPDQEYSTNGGLELGIYAQEQWTHDRLTVNAGVRFDRIKSFYPDQVRPGSTWSPEPFSITGQTVAIQTDLQPRVGVAYDLFDDGRTALKASASRYGTNQGTTLGEQVNPAGTNALQQRAWVDLNGDRYPQGNPLNPAPNGELMSPIDNPAFGQQVITTFYDKDWAFGWGNRFSNWEYSGSVQQQLMSDMSLNVGYFRRTFVNFTVADNRAVGAGDFDRYTVRVPADSRLPGGGGYPITLVTINPRAFGRRPDVITTRADNFGGESRTWNGVDLTLNARRRSFLLQGGLSTGKTSSDYCDLASQVPARAGTVPLEFCAPDRNWLTQVKLLGSYTLPYEIQVAGTYQSMPGPERQAMVTFTSAQIQAALGRPLAGGGAVNVNVIEPGTVYGERFQQVDLRLTKIFRVAGNARVRAMVDLFNVFNANAVTTERYGLGPIYLQPVAIMAGRLVKFAFQFDF